MTRGGASLRWLWLLITSAILCQFALNLARPLISYKVLALGGDAITIGLTSASYALVPVGMALWLGRIGDRMVSLRPLVVVGTIVLAAGPLLLAVSPSLLHVGVASAVLGLGHLCFTIAGQSAIARFVSLDRMDAAFGWFTAAFSLGQMGGPLLAGIAMGTASSVSAATRLSDANTALLVASVISLAAVPFGFGAAVRKERRTTHETAARPPSALSILGIRAVRINIVASLALLTTTDILVAFLPLLGEELGVAPAVVGVLLAIRAAASISSRLMLSVLLRRWRRTTLVMASLAGAALTLAPLPWIFSLPVLAGAMLAVGGFFLGLGQPITMTLVTQAVPAASRGAALALRLLGNRVGQVTLPAAAGLLAAPLGPGGAIWMSCAVMGLACIRWPRAVDDGGGPGEPDSPGDGGGGAGDGGSPGGRGGSPGPTAG